MELPIVSKGTLHLLQDKYSRNFVGNVESITLRVKDILRQDEQKAAERGLLACFIRPAYNSFEFVIHY